MKRKALFNWLPFRLAALVAPLIAAWPQRAQAAIIYWDGVGGTPVTDWAQVSNWSTDVAGGTDPGAVPGSADVPTFSATSVTTAQTVNLNADRSVLGLDFTSGQAHTLAGGGTNRALTIGASGITRSGAGATTIGSTTANQNVNIVLGANQTWTNSNATSDISALNVISGAFSLNLAGTGTFRFAGANTYTGTTTIGAGTRFIAQANAALGTTAGSTTISAGGTLDLGGTLGANALNLGGEAISVSGTGVGGLGAITATGTAAQQNAIQGAVTLTGATTFGGTQRWDIRNNTLNGGGQDLTKVGANSIFLSGSAQIGTALNSLTVRQGEFTFETGALATTAKITNGITLQPTTAVTAAFRSWGNNVDHSANFLMDSSFAGSTTRLEVQNGTTTHSGTITATGGDNRLDVDGNQRMIINGVLAGAGTFRKEDSGLLLVNNAGNTHSGLFNVNGGTLGGSGALASSTVAVNNGAILSPGNALASSGAFSVTNILDLNSTNSAVFNLGTSSDVVNAGTLNQDGTTNIFVTPAAGFTPGTFTLFDYNTLSGSTGAAGFSVANSHVDGTLVNNVGAGSIDLVLNSLNPLTWTGESNGLLSSGSAANPVLPNFNWPADGSVEYVNFDNILFDDTNTGTNRIIVTSTITPASVAFNNSAQNYTVDSLAPSWAAGNISGTTGLVKNGTGTVTLLGANTFTGDIAVNAGTLQLGNESRVATLNGGNDQNPSGAGPAISIAAGATLGIAVGNNVTVNYSSNISGAGDIVLNASEQDPYFNYVADRGFVTFSGNNSGFTGTITINDGNRLTANAANHIGGSSGIIVQDGGALLANGAFTNAVPLTIAGKGWAETGGMLGALRVIGNANLSGPVTLTGDSRITAQGGTGTLSGAISGPHDVEFGYNSTAGGTNGGTLNLTSAASSYSGDTTITRMNINAASLAVAGANSSLGSGDDIVMDSSNLNITGAGPMTTDRDFTLGGLGIGANTIGVTNAANTLTLTGAVNNLVPVAASGQAFRQALHFSQTATAGTGGTVIINTATPIVTGGTNVHRQNLTLAGSTNYTVGASGLGAAGAFNLGRTVGADAGNATLNIQDNAVLTTYGEFDIGNEGVAQTYIVNQSGSSIVNALRGGTAGTATAADPGNRAIRIGHWGSESSTYNLTGGTLNVPNGDLWVGYDGGGTLNQSAGTTVNALGIRMVRNATLPSVYNLNGGIVNVGSAGLAKGGAGASVPQFNLNGGTYRATADHAISSNIAINVQNGGGTIDTNGFNVPSGSRLIGVGTGAFTKAGAGELVLPAGNNDYTGATNITGGALTLNGATSLITASSGVNVGNGAALAGTGGVTAAGGVTLAAGGAVSPGLAAGSGLGALSTTTLTSAAGSMLNLAPGTTDRINVTAANGYNPAAGSIINVLPVGNVAAGTYALVDYAGAVGGGGVAGLVQNIPHFTLPGTAIVDNVGGTSVDLVVPAGAALDTMTWTGTGGATWDHNVTPNTFTSVANPNVAYLAGDRAVFDDSSAIGGIAVAATGVTPADVSFNNSATAYTLTGGGITGGTALTKAGTGTVILANNNTYAGTTTITAGVLQIGNGGTSGTLGTGATVNNATLSFNRSDASTYNGVISGSGVVRSDGTGTTTLTATNTYAGGTTISKGTLLGATGSFGTGTITLNDAATGASDTGLLITPFNNTAAVTIPNNIVVANFGTGTATIGSSEDSLVNTGTFFSGTLQLNRPTRLLGEFDRTTFTNVISGNVGTLTIGRSTGLEDFEIGRVVLEKDNTFVGNVVIDNFANLEIRDISNSPVNTAKNQLPDSGSVTLGDNSFLSLGTSGTAADTETIGDLISSFSTSQVRNLQATANALTYGTANDATFNGIVNGGNTFDLVKQGSGTQTFGGTIDNVGGRMIVNAGTVVLAKDSSNVVHAVGSLLTINNGGTVRIGGTYTAFRDESSNRDNATQYQVNAPANFVDQIFNNLDVTVNTGGTLDLNGRSEVINGLIGTGGTVTNSSAVASTLYIASNNSAGTFPGVIQDGTGVVNIAKGGSGNFTFSGSNTYTGTTSVNAATLTITNIAGLGSAAGGTFLNSNRENAAGGTSQLTINVTTASTPALPHILAEPITATSELSNDLRTAIVNSAESTRLSGPITFQGDGINQITASQAAGDQLQINGGISGTATGQFFLRGAGEIALNSVINVPDAKFLKTDAGLLILNATGHNYSEASLVHGTVRADVVNALDTGAILRMGQNGNANTFDLNGNNQQVAGLLTNPGFSDAQPRTVTSAAAATFTILTPAADGGDYLYAGNITGAVSLVKSGPGAQVLSTPINGLNCFTGTTTINGGTLIVDTNIASSSQVIVNAGGTLEGTGTIGALVVNTGATFSPGHSPGIISTGSVTTSSGSFTSIEIGGLTAGNGLANHDRTVTTGSISLAGNLLVSLVNAYNPNQFDKFLIWTNDLADAVSGTFAGMPEGFGDDVNFPVTETDNPTDYWVISYVEGAMPGSDGNDISLTYIPEPGTVTLAAAASLLALGRRRRRIA